MKPVDVKSSIYIDFDKKNKCKCPKSKIGNGLRTPKCKNIFEKAYVWNWSEDVFVIKNVNITALWTYVIIDLNGEEIAGTFYELQKKTIKRNLR